MRYILTCILLCSFWGLGWGQVTRVEYFVDADPGLGQATAVSFTPGADISASFTVPLTTVSLGFHTLYVRTRDAQRHWSLSSQQAFYTTVLAPANQALTAAEYFIDQEPGLGQGTPIGLGAVQTSATVSFNVGLSTVGTGFHTLYLRTRDAQGAWSLTQAQAFYVLSQAPAGQALTRAEYFIDQDPGLGSGTAIPLPTGQTSAALAFNIPLANVATGAHTLFVRAADRGKAWSLTQQQAFLVRPGGGLATITAFEYRFIGTGANASYTSATLRYAVPTPAASVSLNFTADMSQLPGNADYDMHVWAVSSEGLRSLVQVKRVRACNNLPVKAGFDFITVGTQVSFIDSSRNARMYRWNFGDSRTDTVSNPTHTYAVGGVYTVKLVSSNACNRDTVVKQIAILDIQNVYPAKGGNTGSVTVTILGGGFNAQTTVALVKNGQQINATNVWPNADGNKMFATFSLYNQPVGSWDVVVANGANIKSVTNGFAVEPGINPTLWTQVSGRGAIRINTAQQYSVNVGNTGNIDAHGVPVWIMVPHGTKLVFDSPVYAVVNAGIPKDSIPLFFSTDTLFNKQVNLTDVYPLLLPVISANSITEIRFGITVSSNISANITSWAFAPIYGSPPSPIFLDCSYMALKAAFTQHFGLLNFNICQNVQQNWYTVNSNPLTWVPCSNRLGTNMLDVVEGKEVGCDPNKLEGAALGDLSVFANSTLQRVNLGLSAVFCGGGLLTLSKLNITPFLKRVIMGRMKIAKDEYTRCHQIFAAQSSNTLSVSAVNSIDPNEKIGFRNGHKNNYLQGNKALSYNIYFENLGTATAPAQKVVVVDTLDRRLFDLRTFRLRTVGISNDAMSVAPTGSSKHAFKIDLRPRRNIIVRVDAKLDTVSGVVKWRFISLNPQTMELVSNPLDGFLPPNVNAPEGEGFVSFSIELKAGVPSGTQIRNKSNIFFDTNAPISTNVFLNTVDRIVPTSQVTTLTPAAAPNTFTVTWSGSDQHSGIRDYDILYSVNGRATQMWLSGTSATTALFTGRRDSTYCFYSIARDSAGNVEAAPLVPDACKAIVLSQQAATPATPEVFTIYPNPTPGLFMVEVYALKPEQTSIQIEDVVGHVVYSGQLRLRGGTQRQELDASRFASGIYFVKLSVNGKTVVKKLVKN